MSNVRRGIEGAVLDWLAMLSVRESLMYGPAQRAVGGEEEEEKEEEEEEVVEEERGGGGERRHAQQLTPVVYRQSPFIHIVQLGSIILV